MAQRKTEAWLTSVTSNDSVQLAIVLAKSLRKTKTTRTIAVIVSKNVLFEKRATLENTFDFVFYLENNNQNDFQYRPDIEAKLYAFGLSFFKACVFLEPNTLVTENKDTLFNGKEDFKILKANQTTQVDLSLIKFKPSASLKKNLQEYIGNNINVLENIIEKWMKSEENPFILGYMAADTVTKFSLVDGILMADTASAPIIQFVDFKNNSDFSQLLIVLLKRELGLLDKLIITNWLKLFDQSTLHDQIPLSLLPDITPSKHYINEPIAIVGMSCRYPGANSLKEFWNLIYNGDEAIREPPAFRWTRDQVLGVTPKERQTNAGFLSTPVNEFDAKFFGVSPKEAAFMDPQGRLLHEVLWEALEDAGIDPLGLHGTHTGIFTGSWMNDYKEIVQGSGENDFFRTYMGNSIGATVARLSFLLGLTGPSIATESGCSSAVVALDLAVKSLRLGETNLNIVGGVNLLLHPFTSGMMDFVISPNGRCKTFDAKADGFGRAEGCGVLVLKRLSDALLDRDNIWALIRGSAVSQEGLSRSLGTPTVHCEALCMQLALNDANISPELVTFVETHGTGTPVGDPMEVAAIAKAYRTPKREVPLILGSVKTNVGHTESCSGITGIMKTILAMKHELIPKHRNMESLNPEIFLDFIPAMVPLEHVPWPKVKGQLRVAGVSSFGITGTDGHVIIEEAPEYELPKFLLGLERPLHLLKISAKSKEGLEQLPKEYEVLFLSKSNNSGFADAAFSANFGRANFNYRAFILAKNYKEAAKVLNSGQYLQSKPVKSGNGKKICFLFTGQGSQYQGMSKILYETSPVFRVNFDICDKLLKEIYNISIPTVLWGPDQVSNDLGRTVYSQTSIFCVEYCLLQLWKSWGVTPDIVLGHSLGEFCAAVAADILDFKDALKLVAERSLLIDNLPKGSMLVINASKPEVENILKSKNFPLDTAAVNSSEQTVVAGERQVVNDLQGYLKTQNIRNVILDATHAFHSKHMDPILEEYRLIADSIQFKKGNGVTRYISGMEGTIISDYSDLNSNYWVRHTREQVSFIDACTALRETGCQDFLEIGPHPVLSTFVSMNIEESGLNLLPSLRKGTDDWETILTSLGKLYLLGYKINWKGYDDPYKRKMVSLPFHPFNRKSFWIENYSDGMMINNNIDSIHPLIGSPIDNASNLNIFQNNFSLKSVKYFEDHRIGNRIVFPGAGFVEMCLAAGYCVANGLNVTLETPKQAIRLENLRIETPLELKIGKTVKFQTVTELRESGGDNGAFKVKVFCQNKCLEESGKWLSHASCNFIPFTSTKDIISKWNPSQVQEILANNQPIYPEVFYKTINESGLKFGESFKMIRKYWTSTKSASVDEVVIEMSIPSDYCNYLLHPLIIDATFQSILIMMNTQETSKCKVPIHISRLTMFPGLNLEENGNGGILYLHAKLVNGKYQVFISTQDSVPVALLEQIELIEINVRAFESILEQQVSQVPNAWEESWKVISAQGQDQTVPEIKSVILQQFPGFEAHAFDDLQVSNYLLSSEQEFKKKWIIFSADIDHDICYRISKILKTSGYNVLLVHMAGVNLPHGANFLKNIVQTRAIQEDNEDLQEMESILGAGGDDDKIEGIIYARGMDSKDLDQRRLALPFLNICKVLGGHRKPPKIFILTQGVYPVTFDTISCDPNPATIYGMAKSLKNESPHLFIRLVDLEVGSSTPDQVQQVMYELTMTSGPREEQHLQVAYRGNLRYEPRLVKVIFEKDEELKLPTGTDRYQLGLPSSRSFQDLEFGPMEMEECEAGEVEVCVKAYSLNFRDVFAILKPSEKFEKINSVGLDFSGIVTKSGPLSSLKVGDRVFGANFKEAQLPSHLVIDSELVLQIPEKMTCWEAVTLPAVFLTAYHCLISVVKLKKEETVLIHTGSGGVGLAAIQMAKYLEANIITTAGNTKKRLYLRSLGIQHVFHSRDTSFEKDILRVTKGQGVDVVLNSITGPGIKEATLNACAKNARFVEMSKLSIWTPEEVKVLRPDVDYAVVDLNSLDSGILSKLLGYLGKFLSEGHLDPIPFTKFDALHIRQALEYLRKAQHIGKVVCAMPEVVKHKGQLKVKVPLFNDRSTYLITGGLGGIGFEVCKWMLENGATDVILNGRTPPKPEILSQILKLNDNGFNIDVRLGDIGDHAQCKILIDSIGHEKPLRGVMHCAGVLRDNLYPNQFWQSFQDTFTPKVKGTWNLHNLTAGLPLEHFVLYSSITALLGTPAQSTHVAANCFEDAFIHFRRHQGLPGTSINWGQWAQVGCAKEINVYGILPVSTKRMLNGLEIALKTQKTQICFSDFDSLRNLSVLCPSLKSYLDDKLWNQIDNSKSSQDNLDLKSHKFSEEFNEMKTKNDKIGVLIGYLKTILKISLKIGQDEILEDDTIINDLGVDSIMMIELKNSIQSLVGPDTHVTSNILRSNGTIRGIADAVISTLLDGIDKINL